MVDVSLTSIGMFVIGAALILVAPKIVGVVMKILGLTFLAVGGALYFIPEKLLTADLNPALATIVAVLPAVAGIFLLTVGQGMAKLAVRVAGALIVVSSLASMGVI